MSNKDIQFTVRATTKQSGKTRSNEVVKNVGEIKNQIMREFAILYIKYVRTHALNALRRERRSTNTEPTAGGLTETIKGDFAKVFRNGNIRFRLEGSGKRYFSWYNEPRGTIHYITPVKKRFMQFHWARHDVQVRSVKVKKVSTGFFTEATQAGINHTPELLQKAKDNVLSGNLSRNPTNVNVPKRMDTRKR